MKGVLLHLWLSAAWTLLLCARGQVDLDPSATFPPDDGSSSIVATPLPSSTAGPTTEDPIQRHLALIVGVPTGVGLALIGLCLCGLWLVCSTYCDRRNKGGDQSAGTHSTNMKKRSKEKNVGMKHVGSSAVSGSSLRYEQEEPTAPHEDPTQFEAEDPAHDDPTQFEAGDPAHVDHAHVDPTHDGPTHVDPAHVDPAPHNT